MVFSSNPLSLSVPDPAFESWLRDSGHLDVIDNQQTAAASPPLTTTTGSSTTSCFFGLFSRFWILVSLFTLNPFSKLTTDDFSAQTPSWTRGFFGDISSYSFPASVAQARLRVHENVKRYGRNYAIVFILFFACSLYQMPLALAGLLLSLAIWEVFNLCSTQLGLDRYPLTRQVLVRAAQCATTVILIWLNVHMSLFYALVVSYIVMILHAAFRKLTPAKQPSSSRSR